MNYRHHFHAGNYADVFKHVLLRLLLAGMKRKEKGFLYLDTHAGKGRYVLEATSQLPDGREREPEWPAGIGRLWSADNLPPALAEYVEAVRAWNLRAGSAEGELANYPGSPWIAQALLRPQDRSALCELREDEAEALAAEFQFQSGVKVQNLDGYTALRAMLPPAERRALVLIDPPFENAGEFADIRRGLREALRRFPSGVYAIWYPVTERARSDDFLRELRDGLPGEALLPPALVAELQIAADASPVRMKGCGLLVLNPPWQIEKEFKAVLPTLARLLGNDSIAGGHVDWLVPES